MAESEASAIRFTIDHYEPQGARPDLVHSYGNLMYACDSCNQRKGNRCPPDSARGQGYRFYRPDSDIWSDHFSSQGVRVSHQTNVGYYTIEALDLNRLELRRLRELRQRLLDSHTFIAEGVQSLKRFKLDQLPASIKGKADRAIKKTINQAEKLEADIDDLLREYARSPLSGEDPEQEVRLQERQKKLTELQTIYPGTWRAPR